MPCWRREAASARVCGGDVTSSEALSWSLLPAGTSSRAGCRESRVVVRVPRERAVRPWRRSHEEPAVIVIFAALGDEFESRMSRVVV